MSARVPSFSLSDRAVGSTMHRCAEPFRIDSVGSTARSSFSNAEASPRGLRVISAAEASARNSRFRDTSMASICAMIGARMMATIQMIMSGPPPDDFRREPLPPPNRIVRVAPSERMSTEPTSAATIVMSRMS
jgi:hypothetical protein